MGQTGSGKTTLGAFLMRVRQYVLVPDAKGGDRTLDSLGWPRVRQWPLPRRYRDRVKDGEPVRVIIGIRVNSKEDFEKNAALLRKVIASVFGQGKWTLWCDEGQVLSDRRYVDAGDDLEKLLIIARDRLVSIVYSVQRPQIGRTTPAASAAYSQSDWLFVSNTRDTRVHDRLAEIAGRPAAEMRGLIEALPRYTWACIGLDPTEPIRLVTPPALRPVSTRTQSASSRDKFSTFMWGDAA